MNPENEDTATNTTPIISAITYAPVVATVTSRDSSPYFVLFGAAVNVAGWIPLICSLVSLAVDSSQLMRDSLTWWIIASPILFINFLIMASTIKEKGYQDALMRKIGVFAFWSGIVSYLMPVIFFISYATGFVKS